MRQKAVHNLLISFVFVPIVLAFVVELLKIAAAAAAVVVVSAAEKRN